MAERPEIIAGLKNAVERGYSLELAKQSFINAGYSRQDVEDSARMINSSLFMKTPDSTPYVPQESQTSVKEKQVLQAQLMQQKMPSPASPIQQQTTFQQKPPIPASPVNQPVQYSQPKINITNPPLKEKKSKKGIWIILILVLILILLIAGLLTVIFKAEWITSVFQSLGLM